VVAINRTAPRGGPIYARDLPKNIWRLHGGKKVARASTPILEHLPGPGPGHSLDDKDKDLLKALEPPAPPLALTDRMAEAFTQSEIRALRSPDAAWPHGLRRLDPQAQAMPEYLTEASAARQSAK